MHLKFRLFCCLLLLFLCEPGWAQAEESEGSNSRRLASLAQFYYRLIIKSRPEAAYLAGVTMSRHDRLRNNTSAGRTENAAREDRILRELGKLDPKGFDNTADRLTHAYMVFHLRSAVRTRICRQEYWGVSQMSGWHLTLVQLAAYQPVEIAAFRGQAIKRWSGVAEFVDQEILNLTRGLDRGYTAPKPAVQRVLSQLDGLLAMDVDSSPLNSPAQRSDDPDFKAEFTALISGSVIPAYQRYRDYLQDFYLDRARDSLSVTANPDGRACYEALLRHYTTLDRSPEEVYELGRRTVEANRERVIQLGSKAYGLDSFEAIMEGVINDPEDRFEDRDELLAFSRDAVDRSRQALPEWFSNIPAQTAEVVPYDEFQEGTGVSARYEPGNDERPGIYRIPLFEPQEQSKGAAEATAFHEVWPGHHLQVSIAQRVEGLHPITRLIWFAGYGEGWARYSESLADEMGLYKTVSGPIRRLAWPARGMVVDPGIHVMGWTREQAIEFMGKAGRMTDTELEEMVDRISVLPGQLTSYDSGGLEIIALRAQAEERLGEQFDIREFHDAVLKNGSMPLYLLRQQVEAWIESLETPGG